jgi:hypothetical protein
MTTQPINDATARDIDAAGDARVIGQIRPPGCDLAVPDGWVATDIWWDGTHAELVYDPSRYTVIQARPNILDEHLRADLAATGWRRFGTDKRGCELWVLERNQATLARLDGLRQADAPTALSVA